MVSIAPPPPARAKSADRNCLGSQIQIPFVEFTLIEIACIGRYAKSQYDPCPWSHKEWRREPHPRRCEQRDCNLCFCSELNKIGTAGHTDPLAFPVMSLISMTAGRISVGMYEDTPIKVWNRTLDKLDFRDYIYIEPESERRGLSSFVIQRLMCVWHACREQRAASISQRSRDDIIHSTGRCSISRHVRYVY